MAFISSKGACSPANRPAVLDRTSLRSCRPRHLLRCRWRWSRELLRRWRRPRELLRRWRRSRELLRRWRRPRELRRRWRRTRELLRRWRRTRDVRRRRRRGWRPIHHLRGRSRHNRPVVLRNRWCRRCGARTRARRVDRSGGRTAWMRDAGRSRSLGRRPRRGCRRVRDRQTTARRGRPLEHPSAGHRRSMHPRR